MGKSLTERLGSINLVEGNDDSRPVARAAHVVGYTMPALASTFATQAQPTLSASKDVQRDANWIEPE